MSDLALFGGPPGGIVGARQLVAVQTIDLGRLTHHPVPLVPSALVAVSGTGPDRDSNGSGKTTFLAAVSLLLGDPEWRVATTGGSDAQGLLFDPDLSGDSAGLYDPARVGYVAGVFARSTADGHYDELTVWVRISADDSPRLAARWAPGVHLAPDPQAAAATWNALGRDRQLGPTAFVEQLYGGTGRCLAYVTSRGSRDTDTSLMQLQARLSPARIGSELIVLLGLEHLVDGERDLRAKLADAQQRLAARIDEHERREREWAATLAEIVHRDAAREALARGRELWRLAVARKLLDALAAEERLGAELEQRRAELVDAEASVRDLEARLAAFPDTSGLEQAVTAAEDRLERATDAHDAASRRRAELDLELRGLVARIRELTEQAQGAPDGLAPDAAEQAVREASAALDDALRRLHGAEDRVTAAREVLAAVTEHGETDPVAAAALIHAGVSAVPLLDGVVLAPDARDEWEALLAPWRGAFVVPADQIDRAVTASPPGTVLVVAGTGDSPIDRAEPAVAEHADGEATGPPAGADQGRVEVDRPPAGIEQAPAGTARFLRALLDRADPPFTDVAAGVVVAGGFEHELCGRAAAVERARAAVELAEAELGHAQDDHRRAERAQGVAVDLRDRVLAATELAELRPREATVAEQLADASRAVAGSRSAHDAAQEELIAARVRRDGADAERRRLADELDGAIREVDERQRAISEVEQARAGLDTEGWRRAWGGGDEAAVRALEGDTRKEDSLRRLAGEQLVTALVRLGIDPDSGAGAPEPAITGVIRARRGLEEDVPATNEVRRFDTVAAPLVGWLDDLAEEDASFRDEVEAEREKWDEQIGAARRECENQSDLLERQRDMVEQQIEAALEQVSARYAELDTAAGGYGARLRWSSIRPAQPTDLWVWEVTPEWRRAPGAKWLPYTRQANSAMQKQHRTHLVLAALLAADDPAGRVLIVDEAGNDFGREHLRQVLGAFAHVAGSHGVTVIAACQDKVLEEVAALGAARLLLWFERLSDTSALCRPTRVWGFDPDGGRVELTRPAIEEGRLV